MAKGLPHSDGSERREERELLARATRGDRDALVELLDLHGPGVERELQIGAKWRGLIDAGDVMQITYLEAFLRIGSFDLNRPDMFGAWLRRIAFNNLLDAIRALQAERSQAAPRRLRASSLTESSIALLDLLSAGEGSPSQFVRQEEAGALLTGAIERLPADYAAAIRLYDLEGREISEVAAAMGRTPGAVHMLRLRAHQRLRELLGPVSRILDTTA